DDAIFSLSSIHLEVSNFQAITAMNDPTWTIRYKKGILIALKSELGKAMPSETGGVFIGAINYKTKTIHVVDFIDAPDDSKANPVCFFRGVKNLPERIKDIQERSGGQLGYVGEWHTHPFGPNSLSRTDHNT